MIDARSHASATSTREYMLGLTIGCDQDDGDVAEMPFLSSAAAQCNPTRLARLTVTANGTLTSPIACRCCYPATPPHNIIRYQV